MSLLITDITPRVPGLPRDLVSRPIAAKAAGVSLHAIKSWIKLTEDPLPHWSLGRRQYVSLDEFRAWIDRRSNRPVQTAIPGA